MKKFVSLLFASILFVLCLTSFYACGNIVPGGNTDPSECTHQYGQWFISQEASCADVGIQQRACERCGFIESSFITKLPHKEVIDSAVAATCTAEGKTEGKHCSVCNTILVAQTTIPISHKYNNGTVTTTASCITEGVKEYTCDTCGDVRTEKISKTAHLYDAGTVTTEPTCETNGTKTYTCSVCKQTKTDPIAQLGHQPDENYICQRCGEKCPVELSMTSSEIVDAKKVEWISNRQIDDIEDKKHFRLTFSLKDDSENYLKVPVVVEIEIVNDNGETVYKAIKLVKTSDYSGWSNTYGKQWTAAAIYINYSDITSGTSEKGTVSFKVYNDYVSFDTSTLTIYDNLPLKPTTIILPTLPQTIHDYSYSNKVSSSVKITNITYEISGDDIYFYFTGEKTYDANGAKYSQSCKIGWKLYDADGYVVESDTFYSPQIAEGEKFRNEIEYAWDVVKPGETYTLVISNVD